MVSDRACNYQVKNVDSIFVFESTCFSTPESTPTPPIPDQSYIAESSRTDLRPYRSKVAGAGHGLYQTLRSHPSRDSAIGESTSARDQAGPVSKRTTSPANFRPQYALSSRQSLLVSRCSAVLSSAAPNPSLESAHATWIPDVMRVIASNQTDVTLDLAIEYFISSGEQFWRKGDINDNPARAIGQRALKCLRGALSEDQKDERVLLAIALHEFAEVFMNLGTLYYTCHALGLSLLLQKRVSSGILTELDMVLLDAVHFEEIHEANLSGRDSLFDSPVMDAILDDAITKNHRGTHDSWLLVKNHVKIPRLMRLTSAYLANTSDQQLRISAVRLAESLYTSGVLGTMQRELRNMPRSTTLTPKVAKVVPESLAFDSFEAFSITVRRAAFVVMLCGLLQTLIGAGALPPTFDSKVIEAIDIEAANALAMAVDYALVAKQGVPLVTLRMLAPLQTSLCTWFRLEWKYSDSEQGRHWKMMREWCFAMCNDILMLWKAEPDDLDIRIARTEVFCGGPLTEKARRQIDWSAIWNTMQ